MNFEILSLVVEELVALLTNARVERVYQGRGGGLYILLNRDRKKFNLLLSPDRAMPRLHLVSTKPAAEDPPHWFRPFSQEPRVRRTGDGHQSAEPGPGRGDPLQ